MLAGYATTIFFTTLTVLLAVSYPFLKDTIEWTNVLKQTLVLNPGCHTIQHPDLVGCEDGKLNPESGLVYFTCSWSNQNRRSDWRPVGSFDSKIKHNSGLVLFDPVTEKWNRLPFAQDIEFNPHGLDILPTDDGVLVFAVNHKKHGSVIEKFLHKDGSLQHIETIQDQSLLPNPNSVVAVSENEFYVTNDHGATTPLAREYEATTRQKWSYVVFYDGQKVRKVASDIIYANGIYTSADKQSVWVVSATGRKIHVYERKENNQLRPRDTIDLPFLCDNINLDFESGAFYCAGVQKALSFKSHVKDANMLCPSHALKITNNTDHDNYFGKKALFLNLVQKDGTQMSAASVAVPTKDKVIVSGIFTDGIVVCPK
ncbi:hypothetical protein EDD86DRAFT_195784 [Gorgonomyces haynaldii]|nr:hypothetical protein EDD86DRAFT_195784 [Gorgonomyces haynaldii]